jgi:acyl transferase domain-containing protein
MDDIKIDYYARMNDIFSRYPGPHAPRIRVFSTCQEQMLVDMFTARYFWDNCRNPVQFNNAVSHSLPSSPVFIEISCHPVLSSSILARGVPDARVLCPMRRISVKKAPHALSNEPEIFLDTLGRCSLAGINSLDLSGLYGFSALKAKFIDHPLTPRVISPPKSFIPQHIPSAPGNDGPLSCSNLRINHNTHPDLAEHVINGELAG